MEYCISVDKSSDTIKGFKGLIFSFTVLGFNGAKYLLTGQTFNTSCTFSPNCITSESLCDIKLLHIVHCIGSSSCDGVTQNTSITNNTTISLLKSNLMPGDTGTYLCRYNHTYQDSFNLWVVGKFKKRSADFSKIRTILWLNDYYWVEYTKSYMIISVD